MSKDLVFKWLEDNKFLYDGCWLSFMPPNHIVYKNKEGIIATVTDDEDAVLTVDGKDIFPNNKVIDLFSQLIEKKTCQ